MRNKWYVIEQFCGELSIGFDSEDEARREARMRICQRHGSKFLVLHCTDIASTHVTFESETEGK